MKILLNIYEKNIKNRKLIIILIIKKNQNLFKKKMKLKLKKIMILKKMLIYLNLVI